jgi:hypothetical protein
MAMHTDVQRTVAHVVDLLVAGDYAAIERLSGGIRLSESDLRRALQQYRWKLLLPPPEHYQMMEVFEGEDDGGPRQWSVVMPLWREPGQRSDLSLELTLIEGADGCLTVEVDDLHAL